VARRSAQGRVVLDPAHPGRYSASLIAGLAVLRCFTPELPQRGLAEMADELNLGRSTTHRYASTLVALGLLEQTSMRRYQLSARASDAGMTLCESLLVWRVAREYVRALRTQTGYTAALAVFSAGEIVYLDCWRGVRQGQYAIDTGMGPGTHRPVYCTAAGKAILAGVPADKQNELVARLKLRRHGPKTIKGKTALRKHLEDVAVVGRGIALEDEELLAGRRALGAPVLDSDGAAVAAVELVVPVGAVTREELVSALMSPIRKAASQITLALLRETSQSAFAESPSSGEAA
jgi:DNA-binding IclR family transcriptional regulator